MNYMEGGLICSSFVFFNCFLGLYSWPWFLKNLSWNKKGWKNLNKPNLTWNFYIVNFIIVDVQYFDFVRLFDPFFRDWVIFIDISSKKDLCLDRWNYIAHLTWKTSFILFSKVLANMFFLLAGSCLLIWLSCIWIIESTSILKGDRRICSLFWQPWIRKKNNFALTLLISYFSR